MATVVLTISTKLFGPIASTGSAGAFRVSVMPTQAGPATGARPVAAGDRAPVVCGAALPAGAPARRWGRGRYPYARWCATSAAWCASVPAEGVGCTPACAAVAALAARKAATAAPDATQRMDTLIALLRYRRTPVRPAGRRRI